MSTEIDKILAQLANHQRRISLLEGTILPAISKKPSDSSASDYYGPTGGVKYLISKGFMKDKRDLAAVRQQLTDEGYHYSRQAIHEALKTSSKPSGPLVSLKEGARKVYVERK